MSDTRRETGAQLSATTAHDWLQLLAGVPFDWALIPLNGRKCPIDPATGQPLQGWNAQDGYSPEQLAGMNCHVRAVGVLLGPASGGLLAVDFDGPGAEEMFLESTGHSSDDLPPTIAVTSGRDKRQQRFFTVDPDWIDCLRSRQFKNSSGNTVLEFRWQGAQSVIAGDHPDTAGYRWLDGCSPAEVDPAPAPAWLLEAVVTGGPQVPTPPPPIRSNSDDGDRARAMLQCLPASEFQSYDAWLEVGMALHGTDPGLLNDWVEWSRSMANFDVAECLQKWQSFGNYPGRRRTIASLHQLAQQHGYREPKRSHSQLPADEDDDDRALQIESLKRFREAQLATIDLSSVLGPFWGQLLIDRAAAFPCDPNILLLPLLGYVASLVGTNARVQVKPGWSEPLLIWGLVAQPASSLKSPAGSVFLNPLIELQRKEKESYDQAYSLFEGEEKAWKDECARQKKVKSPLDLPAPPEPPIPHRHYYVENVTIERLGAIHAQPNVRGLIAFHDELADWFNSQERNSKTSDRARWLRLWNGSAIKHDTVTGTTVFCPKTAISLVGFIQPDKLASLHAAEAHFDFDSSGDGLWARFLPVIPRTLPFEFNTLDTDITPDLIALAQQLEQIPADSTLDFHPDAVALMAPVWRSWSQQENESSASRGAFIGKLRGYSVRLAGLLHLLNDQTSLLIKPDTAQRSLTLSAYFLSQFDLLAPQVANASSDISETTARFLSKVRDRSVSQVSVRELQRWCILGRNTPAKEARAFLQTLADQGVGSIQHATTKGSKEGSWVWLRGDS